MDSILAALEESFVSYTDNTSTNNKPYVTLAYAQSLDGSIAAEVGGDQLILSGKQSMVMTHRLRAWHDAIIVGVGTIVADNPSLTVRLCSGDNPLPVILDPTLRTPTSIKLLNSKQCHSNPIIAYIKKDYKEGTKEYLSMEERKRELMEAGATLLPCESDSINDKWLDLNDLMLSLKNIHKVCKIMVEGGSSIITSMLITHYRENELSMSSSSIVASSSSSSSSSPSSSSSSSSVSLNNGLINMINITISPTFIGGVRSVKSILPHKSGNNGDNSNGTSSGPRQFPSMKSTTVVQLERDIVIQGTVV